MSNNREAVRLHAEAAGYKAAISEPGTPGRTDIDQYGKDGRVVAIKWSRDNRVLDVLVDFNRPMVGHGTNRFDLQYRGLAGAMAALT